ncbi:hypothetical protein [Methanobrevibacter sp.]|uniref:hypothetical protein n=1 Tax=Methanobrevibacter sp. TaxID=66852 RepID=UPI00388FB75E
MAKSFKYAKINDELPKRDIGVLLGAMILKHFDDAEKINELMEDIDMKQINDEIRIIAREEYADKLEKIEKENIQLKNKQKEIENKNKQMETKQKEIEIKIKKLSEMKDLNSQKARKILNSLIVH